jgi:hypothetical protein
LPGGSRGLGDVYKRQGGGSHNKSQNEDGNKLSD